MMRKFSPQQMHRIRMAALAQILYPRRCPFCGRVIGFIASCKDCRDASRALELRDAVLPAEKHLLGRLCGAAAVYRYSGCVREAICAMKYHGCRWYAWDLGCMLVKNLFGCTFCRKYGIILPEPGSVLTGYWDVIIPVPDSGRGRGYNVPELLAQPLALATGLSIQSNALRRVRNTKPQAGLPADARLANVVGAFAPTQTCQVKGLRVLLIDDVITTGATVSECAKVLLDAGAVSVFALGLASSRPGADAVNLAE